MAEVTIEVGGRAFDVACQDGEEHFLKSAAEMLDAEARTLVEQMGRIPEARMLLMAGLMLADKTAAAEDAAREAQARVVELEAAAYAAQTAAGPSESVLADLEKAASQAEAIAASIKARSG